MTSDLTITKLGVLPLTLMHSVTIHQYTSSLTAIEFGPESDAPENFVLFVGGLTDGFLTVPYVPQLASSVAKLPNWVVVQALIGSSYLGFGTGSLKRDAKDLAKLVRYLRTKRGTKSSKVVLMGHSTGCQDTMEYLSKLSKEPDFDSLLAIDGGILQAPVSDCEAFEDFYESTKLAEFVALASKLIEEGKPNEMLPAAALKLAIGAPVTAYRFHSLASRHGDDDYFSSYLTDEDYQKSFGVVSKPLLVLYGEKDQFVPSHVDKQALIDQWKKNTSSSHWSHHSKLLKGANHNVGPGSDEGAVEDLIETVVAFVKDI